MKANGSIKNVRLEKKYLSYAELDERNIWDLIENIHRKTLDPKKEWEAFKSYVVIFGWVGISHLAAKIGKSVTYVQRHIQLWNLALDILDSISNSSVSTALGQELLYLTGEDKQSEMMQLFSQTLRSSWEGRALVKDLNFNFFIIIEFIALPQNCRYWYWLIGHLVNLSLH
jgi:hypothetical protein